MLLPPHSHCPHFTAFHPLSRSNTCFAMAKDWDMVKAHVYEYYVEDKMSLIRVMNKMAKEHGFEASWVNSKHSF